MGEQGEQSTAGVSCSGSRRDDHARLRRSGGVRGGDGWELCEVEVLAEHTEPGRSRFWVHIHLDDARDGFRASSPASALDDLRADGWDLVPVYSAESFELRHRDCRRMSQERPPRAPRPDVGRIDVVEKCVGWRRRPGSAADARAPRRREGEL